MSKRRILEGHRRAGERGDWELSVGDAGGAGIVSAAFGGGRKIYCGRVHEAGEHDEQGFLTTSGRKRHSETFSAGCGERWGEQAPAGAGETPIGAIQAPTSRNSGRMGWPGSVSVCTRTRF